MQAFPAWAIFSTGGSYYKRTSTTPLSFRHTRCWTSNVPLRPLAKVEALKGRGRGSTGSGGLGRQLCVMVQFNKATDKQIVWNRGGYFCHLPHSLFLDIGGCAISFGRRTRHMINTYFYGLIMLQKYNTAAIKCEKCMYVCIHTHQHIVIRFHMNSHSWYSQFQIYNIVTLNTAESTVVGFMFDAKCNYSEILVISSLF